MATKQVFNTSAELDYPTVLPTLDLDFANSKTLDPRITFTRASGGSYVGADGLIKYAGVNEARFDHDPATGESLGLLIEEQRTNLLLRSEEFDDFFWGIAGGATVSTGQNIISPDGKTGADILGDTNGLLAQPFTFQTLSFLDNTVYTISVYLKAGTKTTSRVGFRVKDGSVLVANFDLNSGTTTIGNTIASSITPVGNGWYRCTATANSRTGATSQRGVIYLDTGNYLQTGTGTMYVWGAQLEAGSFPTSYIPTQGSTRTRGSDDPLITGKNFSSFYNRTESSIFVEYLMKGNFGVSGFNRVLEISDGTSQNRFAILKLGSTSSTYESFNINNIAELNFATISSDYGSFYKYTVAFKENDFVRYRIDNTNILRSNIDSTLPLSKFFPNQLSIGYEVTSNVRQLDGYIRRLTYYPKRLPNSQLQALVS
jgi:hypothetical protein